MVFCITSNIYVTNQSYNLNIQHYWMYKNMKLALVVTVFQQSGEMLLRLQLVCWFMCSWAVAFSVVGYRRSNQIWSERWYTGTYMWFLRCNTPQTWKKKCGQKLFVALKLAERWENQALWDNSMIFVLKMAFFYLIVIFMPLIPQNEARTSMKPSFTCGSMCRLHNDEGVVPAELRNQRLNCYESTPRTHACFIGLQLQLLSVQPNLSFHSGASGQTYAVNLRGRFHFHSFLIDGRMKTAFIQQDLGGIDVVMQPLVY